MYADIRHWVESCTTCGGRKMPKTKVQGQLRNIVVTRRWELIGMDFLGPFSRAGGGSKWVLVITEYLTKYPIVVALPDATAETVARAIIQHIILPYGAPARILTDRGANFNAELIREVYSALTMHKSTTTAYHPQCDGLTERFNDTLANMIAKILEEHPLDWEEAIPYALMAFRNTPHSSTNLSPHFALFGVEMTLPLEIQLGTLITDPILNKHTLLRDALRRLADTTTIIKDNNLAAQEKQSKYYDGRAMAPTYKEGDLVWVFFPPRPKLGESKKFLNRWRGPCKIVAVRNNGISCVVEGERVPKQTVHTRRIKRWVERVPLSVTEEEIAAAEEAVSMDTIAQNIHRDETTPDINIPVPPLPEEKLTVARIIQHTNTNGINRYLVAWRGMTECDNSWVEEEDMMCPELLAKYWNPSKDDAPDLVGGEGVNDVVAEPSSAPANAAPTVTITDARYLTLKNLLDVLRTYLIMLEGERDRGIPTKLPTCLRRMREWVGGGSAFLSSSTMVAWFTKQLKNITSVDTLINLLKDCITQPYSIFDIEIKKLDFLAANPTGNERMRRGA